MIETLFILFSVSTAALLAWRIGRHAGGRAVAVFIVGTLAWLGYAAVLAGTGVLVSPNPPPRLLLLLLPLITFAIWAGRSRAALSLALRFPLRELIGLQGFRLIVELFLHRLMVEDRVPKAMTFEGHNFDIVTGASALVLYAAWNHLPNPARISKAWNYLGLTLLAVVAITGILSAPGPQQSFNLDHPNLAVTQFPYVFIPALFVAAALCLHILALRRLSAASPAP